MFQKSIFRRKCLRSNSLMDVYSNLLSFNEMRKQLNIINEKEDKTVRI